MAKPHPFSKGILALGVIGILVMAVAVYTRAFPATDAEQPLQYNHKVHIENAGLTCIDCHTGALKSPVATIPTLETCSLCHSTDPISESPEERRLLEVFIGQGKEIPWKRIYRVPDHVYFSHRRHTVGGELECSQCHGDVSTFETPVVEAARPVTMERCMDCHRELDVTNDCLACHR